MLDKLFDGIRKKQHKKERIVYLQFKLNYNSKLSNSHSSPINGVQNFKGDESLPTGYPGLEGRIWVVFEKEPEGFGLDYIIKGVNTGTGGYGCYTGQGGKHTDYFTIKKPMYPVSYHCKIFEDDWKSYWTEITELIEQDKNNKATTIISNGQIPYVDIVKNLELSYEWVNPKYDES